MKWIKTSYITFLRLAGANFNLYLSFQGNMIYGRLFLNFQVHARRARNPRVKNYATYQWYLGIFQLKQIHHLSWFLYDNIHNLSWLSHWILLFTKFIYFCMCQRTYLTLIIIEWNACDIKNCLPVDCPKNDFFREVIGSPEEIGLAREFRSIDQSSAEILTKEIYQPINLYF